MLIICPAPRAQAGAHARHVQSTHTPPRISNPDLRIASRGRGRPGAQRTHRSTSSAACLTARTPPCIARLDGLDSPWPPHRPFSRRKTLCAARIVGSHGARTGRRREPWREIPRRLHANEPRGHPPKLRSPSAAISAAPWPETNTSDARTTLRAPDALARGGGARALVASSATRTDAVRLLRRLRRPARVGPRHMPPQTAHDSRARGPTIRSRMDGPTADGVRVGSRPRRRDRV